MLLSLVVGSLSGPNMGKIDNIPVLLRPREKAMRHGISSLSDAELFAVIIASGTRNYSALEIGQSILMEGGLPKVGEMTMDDLMAHEGISKINATKIAAVIEIAKRYSYQLEECDSKKDNFTYLVDKYQTLFHSESQEHLIVVSISKGGGIIYESDLYQGTGSDLSVSVLEILREVVKRGGKKFYVLHNHPSGSETLTPSDPDIAFTYLLIEDAKKLNLEFLDHIIISPKGYYSFADNKDSPFKGQKSKKSLAGIL